MNNYTYLTYQEFLDLYFETFNEDISKKCKCSKTRYIIKLNKELGKVFKVQ